MDLQPVSIGISKARLPALRTLVANRLWSLSLLFVPLPVGADTLLCIRKYGQEEACQLGNERLGPSTIDSSGYESGGHTPLKTPAKRANPTDEVECRPGQRGSEQGTGDAGQWE